MDANYKFIMLDIGSKGCFSDGRIFSSSFIGQRIKACENLSEDEPLFTGGPKLSYVVIGDEVFPLLRCLMHPGKNLQKTKRF